MPPCSARTTRRWTSRCTTSAWRANSASSPRCTRAAGRRARPTAGRCWRPRACSASMSTSCTATRSTTRSCKRFCDLGMSFSAAAESEMSQGHGHPLTGRLRKLGRAPSLGVDLESVLSRRHADAGAHRARHPAQPRQRGAPRGRTAASRRRRPSPRIEALAWVTVEGARMLRPARPHRHAGGGQAGRPRADPRRRPEHAAGARPGGQRGVPGLAGQHRQRDGGRALEEARTAGWSASTWRRRSRR